MAQQLKSHIRDRILDAATERFSASGYAGASIADIARSAGISTGNVYRYFKNKDALFYTVISTGFVREFKRRIRTRVMALRGIDDIRDLQPMSEYHLASEKLLEFCIRNRLRVVILLTGSDGSRYEGFARQMTADLVGLAISHLRSLDPDVRVSKAARWNLEQIYTNFVRVMAEILDETNDADRIRQLVAGYSAYHLTGLKALFEWIESSEVAATRSGK